MAITKYIIDKSDLAALLRGEDLAIQPRGNIRGFCIEIAGNVTNGDMVKAMFPDILVAIRDNVVYTDLDDEVWFNLDWWNAPYKAESGGEE